MELFEITRLVCKGGSNRFLTWLRVCWDIVTPLYYPFPDDFTHLMVASWFGQQEVVERLLKEEREINARSKEYGTALNVSALRKEEDITRMLLERGVSVYLRGNEYKILHVETPLVMKQLVND